ncbi:MAG: hypothetical protein ACM31L_05335 [Actinomycetota bacterium]
MDGALHFDLREAGYFIWTTRILGLAAASLALKLGLYVLGRRDDGGIYGSLLPLAVAMGMLAVVVAPVEYWESRTDRELAGAFDAGKGTVVEGVVEGYQPSRVRTLARTLSYESGTFQIGGQLFFIDHGNPAEDFLANGKRVRVSMVDDVVVRIELLP